MLAVCLLADVGPAMSRSSRQPQTNSALLAIFLLILSELLVEATSENDPYRILRVSRKATHAEIKRAYKNLVKEWHPDKNKDPMAEEMFIKITKSYEILSNQERRTKFDRYGHMEDNQHFTQPQQQGYRSFHSNFYFEESFFQFPRDFADSKYLLHHSQFNSEVLPDSHKRPYLIKVTSEWCFACIHIEPVWKEVVQELEPLGVGIGIVNLGSERLLANQLGAYHAPSIIGLMNGRVTFFHQAVVRDHLRQFIEDLLPQTLVEKITSRNYLAFLNSWYVENKPSILLFDQVPVVPLLYKLTAFAFRNHVRFGFVDQGDTHSAEIVKKFNINTYAPTMLLFKEDTEKPVDIIQARGMKRQIMWEFVSNNKFLKVPRLVNQQLFEELCPVKRFHHRRKYCVLLISGDDQVFHPGNKAFLDFASANTKDMLRFIYVNQRHQQPFCQALCHNQSAQYTQVVILERKTQAGKVLYHSVSGEWNGSEEDKHRLHEHLELLLKEPNYLNSDATLPDLNNEMAPIFLVHWMNVVHEYALQMYDDILYSNWREMMPILSLFFSALFIFFGTVIIQAFSEPNEGESQKAKSREPPQTEEGDFHKASTSSHIPKKDFVEVTELTDDSYTSKLVKLRPGHINIVLVLNNTSKNVLLKKFATEVFPFSRSPNHHYSFLNADKHRHWMPSLLRSASCPNDSVGQLVEYEESSDYIGHVLALNGYKKYLCLYRPVFVGDDPNNVSSSSDVRSRSRSRSYSSSSSNSSEDETNLTRDSGRLTIKKLHHKLDRLGLWMERMIEGTLTRFYVPAWPSLHENTDNTTPPHS